MRGWLLLVTSVAALSCREPTQVTLKLSTDAVCASEPLEPLMLVRTVVAAGTPEQVARPGIASNTATPSCDGGDIGTVVLYPEDGAKDAGVLVIGLLQTANGAPTEEQCLAFANPKPGQPPVDGSGCIVARRTLGFIDHVPLELPITLNVACAGKVCAADETCVVGPSGAATCASAAVSCNETGGCISPEPGGGGGGGGGVTATLIGDLPALEEVSGSSATGTAYALDLDEAAGVMVVFEVVANDLVQAFVVPRVPTGASKSFYVLPNDGNDAFAWNHLETVELQGNPFPVSPLVDFVPRDAQSFWTIGPDGYGIFGQASPIGVQPGSCPISQVGVPASIALGGDVLFVGGGSLCSCRVSPELAGTCAAVAGFPITDVAGHPSFPVAVAVAQDRIVSAVAPVTTLVEGLQIGSGKGRLGKVHVTPSGVVWAAGGAPAAGDATLIVRGTVNPDATFGPTWSEALVPGLGGVRSFWATDVPTPAAYVVTQGGALYRIEGL